MPDTLTTGVSLGLLAGIVSGVCYIYANGISWTGKRYGHKKSLIQTGDRGICRRCGGDYQGGFLPCICGNNKQNVKFGEGAWFLRQIQKGLMLMPWSTSSDRLDHIEEESDDYEELPQVKSKDGAAQNIREFLEAISGRMAGGSLEGTQVTALYDHPNYIAMFRRYHKDIRDALTSLVNALKDALTHLPGRNDPSATSSRSQSTASSAHAQLKRLVARVVEEAASLPAFAKYAAEPSRTPSVETSTYEDLLASAILNKVIERYQHENGSGGRSSGIHSASASPTPSERSTPRSLQTRHNRDITPPLHEEDEDDLSDWEADAPEKVEVPRRVPFPEFGGDIIHATENDDRDFDEVSSGDIQAVDGSWEENWLFQRKKIKTQSVPVPMLVPNSNTDYRVLIGDRDADDTTDLSDNGDETEEIEYKSDMKRVLDSKHIIGGAQKVDEYDFEPDSLTVLDDQYNDKSDSEDEELIHAINIKVNDNKQTNGDVFKQNNKISTSAHDAINHKVNGDSYIADIINLDELNDIEDKNVLVLSVNSGPIQKTEFAVKGIHRTQVNGTIDEVDGLCEQNGDIQNKQSEEEYKKNRELKNNTLNGHEREGEYEETVTKPVQRYADSLRRKHFEEKSNTYAVEENDENSDLIPGSIADRERKKWLNYVEMPNNPYSPEAIQKRLSAKSSSSIFDMITKSTDDVLKRHEENNHQKSESMVDVRMSKSALNVHELGTQNKGLSMDEFGTNGSVNRTPSPRILKDALAEEIPQYKRYGRDYYIKEAKKSCGARKKSSFSDTSSVYSMRSTSIDNIDDFGSTGLLIKQFNTIATSQQYKTFSGKKQIETNTIMNGNRDDGKVMIEYENVNERTLFTAKPVITADEDTDKKFEEILQASSRVNDTKQSINVEIDNRIDVSSEKSPASGIHDSIVSSSSNDDSLKIYNVPTGEIVKSKSADNISRRYKKTDDNDNIDIRDKNTAEINTNCGSAENVSASEVREDKLGSIDELSEIQMPKVRDLARKFISMDNLNEDFQQIKPRSIYSRKKSIENIISENQDKSTTKQYMHSLTARSISKKFREELKLSMATPLKMPGGTNELPEGEVAKETTRPESPLPEPGSIKTKLAFFESLRSMLNGKF